MVMKAAKLINDIAGLLANTRLLKRRPLFVCIPLDLNKSERPLSRSSPITVKSAPFTESNVRLISMLWSMYSIVIDLIFTVESLLLDNILSISAVL